MTQPEFQNIPLNQIHVRQNYRKTFKDDTLKALASSIKKNGVLQPILVRPNSKGFELIAGERRLRASLLAGLATIPSVIREVADQDCLRQQIVENVQREGVPFMESAYGFKQLRDEGSYDVAEIARIVGKSERYVYLMLQLTAMSDDARRIAEAGWISQAVAFHIARLPHDYQTKAANDLARTKKNNLVTENGAKSYIRENFQQEDTYKNLRKKRVAKFGPNSSSDYAANWKHYLVNFSVEQFEGFKKIVRGRTETAVLSEAVDIVMRGGVNPAPGLD